MRGLRAAWFVGGGAWLVASCGGESSSVAPSAPDASLADASATGDARSDPPVASGDAGSDATPAGPCGPGTRWCGSTCVDPRFDPGHCGGCDTPCTAGLVCAEATCRLSCSGGTLRCGDRCVDPQIDPSNCGGCGADAGSRVCGVGQVCSGGQCVFRCGAGLIACAGQCIDPLTNTRFCGSSGLCGQGGGSAGMTCPQGRVCANGGCTLGCPAGFVECGGGCVDPKTSRAFCGASGGCGQDGGSAGTVCLAGQVCIDGSCRLTCPSPLLACAGSCIDPQSNPSHCGASGDCQSIRAGVACPAGQACLSGRCVPTAFASCAAVKQSIPSATSGIYLLDPDGAGTATAFAGYCDMTTDGGGWLLVGRSRPVTSSPGCATTDGGTSFGWGYARGNVADDSQAYSLNVKAQGVAFTEILFGDYASGKDWVHAYKQTVGADFLTAHATTHRVFGQVTAVLGTCAPDVGSMFSYIGFTNNADTFHFRDVDGPGYGLTQSGWYTCYQNCYAGDINGKAGMIFVR